MFFIKYVLLFLLLSRFVASQQEDVGFTYNGFQGVNMTLDGLAQITDNGLLMLVNTTLSQVGHAFYPQPICFKNSSSGNVFSFSTTFVFALFSEFATLGGPGIVFVIASSKGFPYAMSTTYMGLRNTTNVGISTNHVVGVELDTFQNTQFDDIDDNHVGIDINDFKYVKAASASYFSDQENQQANLSLYSGHTMQLWVEYNGIEKQLNVTLAPTTVPAKPTKPLLSLNIDLSPYMVDPMFVGFSSSTCATETLQYVLGWSYKMNGQAKEFSLSQLPKLPRMGPKPKSKFLNIGLPAIGACLLFLLFVIIQFVVARKKKFAEVLEDWELEYGPHRFRYNDLYIATIGFHDKELLGIGGFGKVYRGVLPTSKEEVAVKRVSHDSAQGVREFIAENISIGKLQHRNIVTLLGYCWWKGELLLVYDFMPNGSLDKFLFDHQSTVTKTKLSWNERFQIIKNVASALLYLHEEWEQVVVHRDIKSGNVMLDRELNGRLGDFGLAKLYDHGGDPKTTHVVGTFGYLAPEFASTGKANPSVDVFTFGIFLLEVACGRRPIYPQASEECIELVDWVISSWNRGAIFETMDPKLEMTYEVEEMELVLKLGLLCSQSDPIVGPCMRQVVRCLEGEIPQPDLLPLTSENTGEVSFWCPYFSSGKNLPSSIANSLLSGRR